MDESESVSVNDGASCNAPKVILRYSWLLSSADTIFNR